MNRLDYFEDHFKVLLYLLGMIQPVLIYRKSHQFQLAEENPSCRCAILCKAESSTKFSQTFSRIWRKVIFRVFPPDCNMILSLFLKLSGIAGKNLFVKIWFYKLNWIDIELMKKFWRKQEKSIPGWTAWRRSKRWSRFRFHKLRRVAQYSISG